MITTRTEFKEEIIILTNVKAKDIMETNVISVKPDTTIEALAQILLTNKISGVPVVDANNKLIGIVTEGDLLHKQTDPKSPAVNLVLGGLAYMKEFEKYGQELKKLSACTASEIMTETLAIVTEDTSVKEISTIMVDKNINRVPVVRDGVLIGLVSRADVLKTLA